MNYITIENIAKSYGERTLFSDLSFGINAEQKIGLIAKNGVGKSSLLDIVSHREFPDAGQVNYRKGIKVSFLPQEPDLDAAMTIKEVIFSSENETLRIIEQYEKALQHPEDTENYQKAFDLMEAKNAWDFETEYNQILSIFRLNMLDKKISQLSGGQKKRLALATLLLDHPDVLILDEPTNHLDLEMVEWLEGFFKKEKITLLMVTHDRYFLDRVCNEIIELEDKQLYSYKGNYGYYLRKKEERLQVEAATTAKAKQLYKKELTWMRRQPKARGTKAKSRIDDFADIKARASKRRQEHEVQLEINMERLGNKVMELHNISKSYGEKTLFANYDYNFQHGDRIGIIGKNGSGKTTFLNILTGKETPDTGKIVVGETVKVGHYQQKGITIKPEQKVIDVIREYGDFIPLKKGRQISAPQLLERFLFDRKKQYDYVEKLSGGERKRLYLCTILIQNPNFLILDEPTNDLDILTLNVLENFLLDYPGCLVVVSHDRYFMDKIVDHLFVFRGQDIKDFPGNYSDYRSYESSRPAQTTAKDEPAPASTNAKPKTDGVKLSYNENKEFKRLEKEIPKLEKRKTNLEQEFLKELTPEEIAEKSKKLQEISDNIDQKTERWFELSSKSDS